MDNNNITKILYIVTKSDLGGVQKYLLELTKGLPQNIIPYFLMSSEGYLSKELKNAGIKDEQIFFVPMTNSIINIKIHISAIKKTLDIIKNIEPDLIHCNSTTGGIIGRISGRLSKKPVVFTAHGWAFTNGILFWKRIFYKILETFLACFTQKIICVSEFDKQLGIKTMPFFKDKMITIHNGISNISDKYTKNEFSKKELKIVMISRFCPQKDPYTLISAVHKVNCEGFPVKLDLYGYGEELKKVLAYIKSQSDRNVSYKGEITDIIPILKDYDVYSLISNWEGLPIGILEAMRAGLPILISDVGGNSELIKDNGYLVKRQNVTDCKEKIKELWKKRQELAQIGQNSRRFYEENFLSEKMIEKTLDIYKSETRINDR